MLDPVPTQAFPTPAVPCHPPVPLIVKPPNAKKIFLFLDGTGNEFIANPDKEKGNSNVVKLYTTLRVADNQVAYYHPGVGTMGDPTIRHRLPRFWSMIKGLAFGAGFQANVLDAYRYLMEVYNDGDDIYIFGFSRGAYTARALAAMLHGYGLLCRGNEGHLLYAWNMFVDNMAIVQKRLWTSLLKRKKRQRLHSVEPNKAFKLTYSREVTIRFMGIWDTVSSVGWIYKPLRLLSMAQNPILQVGRHAVSIDERRAFYRDNLWGTPLPCHDPEWPAVLKAQCIQQDVTQVWFPGVHSDIGGSYSQTEAAPANVTLEWMIEELQQHGAVLCQERIDIVLGKTTAAIPDPMKQNSGIQEFTDQNPCLQNSGGLTTTGMEDLADIYKAPKDDHKIHDSLKDLWWILQAFPQQYYSKDTDEIQLRVPYGRPRAIPANAIIHKSAYRRLISTVPGQERYKPRNLERNELIPINEAAADQIPRTTANIAGCFICVPSKGNKTTVPDDPTVIRYAKLALGGIAYGAFWLVLIAFSWNLGVLLALLYFWVWLNIKRLCKWLKKKIVEAT